MRNQIRKKRSDIKKKNRMSQLISKEGRERREKKGYAGEKLKKVT